MLFKNHLKVLHPDFLPFIDKLVDIRALELLGSKIEKISGDLRQAFSIVRETLQKKVDSLKSSTSYMISIDDINGVLLVVF